MKARPRITRSIRARVTAGAFAVTAVVLGVAAVSTVIIVRDALTDGVAVALEQDLDSIGDRAEADPDTVRSIDDDLLVRLDGPTPVANDDDASSIPSVGETPSRVTVDGDSFLAASDDTERGRLTVARPLDHVDDSVSTTTVLLAAGVPSVVVLICIVVWVVSGRALAPVERLRREVDAIGADDLADRVEAGRDDELGELASTMNRLLDRIEQARLTQRRFVSDASHELRSPLATIRQHAEVADVHPSSTSLSELSGVVLAEGARMQDLVEGLLILARLDEHRGHTVNAVDLDDIVLSEARRLRGIGVDVDTRGVGAARVEGNEALLSRVVRNLADNAARHASQTVTLRLSAGPGDVRLEVEDDGAGIPLEHRERVFDRFTRLDEARARDSGGSGLGLAMTREIVRSHGGDVVVSDGSGGGALLTVTLPGDGRP
ncbi:Signal transduction histidine kinase [Gordonia malaquae]|uniref:histidine kinase n=1 Tax=Gordonia malaquae NBRC 108250 TaxID=1223542 RepID=M3UI75_GORML|nr:HAMP domain-containing sensor histidine kinase [Gordonia malaquae]GAC79120.1 two-component histidine kinase MprB [Gordonia malaquae NBRC 108250]SEE09138.1 Signal transduction histidine kinase [Gordonia malaquae]